MLKPDIRMPSHQAERVEVRKTTPPEGQPSPTKAMPGTDEIRDIPSGALPPGPPTASRQRLRTGVFLLLRVVLVAFGFLYVFGGQVVSTDNVYIQADHVGVSTDVAGIVESVESSTTNR